MQTVWSGPPGDGGHFDRSQIPNVVMNCLSRSQLKDVILLQRCNPNYDVAKLIAIIAILEDDCRLSAVLEKYGLTQASRLSASEETEFSRMDRNELEKAVLSLI